MFFLVGAIIVIVAYLMLRRDSASLKRADQVFTFGAFLIAVGIIFILIQLYAKARR
jgi:heme/copper-type cytochrome/quinol oxidase subunit 1